MYYASQQVNTVSKYILQYALSNIKDGFEPSLKQIFEKYTKIIMDETAGMLVLRKLKNMNYEFFLGLVLENTSTVVYKGTLFMNESEYLDIDIDDLFSEENTSQREVTDIKISGNLYIRPLFTIGESLGIVMGAVLSTFGNEDIKALVNFCRSKIEIPTEVLGFVEKKARYIDSKGIKYLVLMTAGRICNFNNPKLLKMVLDLKLSIDISIQEMELLETRGGFSLFHLINFLKDFGYTARMYLLVYIAFLYYLVLYQKNELTEFLMNSYPDKACQQILFDMVILHSNVDLVEEYFLKVEPNSENIIRVASMAYRCDREDLIRFLLNNSDKIKSDLDENAVMTAIKNKNYGLIKKIIEKYPKSVSIACLKTAVESDEVRIAKLIIDAGVDLTSPDFEGIEIASSNKNVGMLRLLLENGAIFGLYNSPDILELCYIQGFEVTKHLMERFGNDSSGAKISEIDIKAGTRLKFNKTLLYLIVLFSNYPGNFKDIGNFDMVKLLVESGVDLSDSNRNGVLAACKLGLKRTLKYLSDNNAVMDYICICYLKRAYIDNDIELVEMILEYYVDLGTLKRRINSDKKEREGLQDHSHLDNENSDRFEEYKVVKTLLEKCKPIENYDLLNVMEMAISWELFDVLKLLATYEIKFHIDTSYSYNIFNTAIINENIEMVEYLLKNRYIIEGSQFLET
ncbi:putative ankyrin repeat protein L25, partial [Zancudomyces culisetae]